MSSLVGSPLSSPPDTSFDRRVSGASIGSLPPQGKTSEFYPSSYLKFHGSSDLGHYSREELVDIYHILIKEKRELRRRNAQAQTNIVQYFRKHKMDLFSGKGESNSEDLKEEYSNLLGKMMSLNEHRLKENTEFGMELESIEMKKTELENEVSQLNKEIMEIKSRLMRSLFNKDEKDEALGLKIINEHHRGIARIIEEMRPHRLEMVKLRERLDWLEKKYEEICDRGNGDFEGKGSDDEEDLSEGLEASLAQSKGDTLELALENQVYADRMDKYKNDIALAKEQKEKKLVSITHLRMKINEVLDEIDCLSKEGEKHLSEIHDLKKESREVTKEIGRNIKSKLELQEKMKTLTLEDHLESFEKRGPLSQGRDSLNLKKFII